MGFQKNQILVLRTFNIVYRSRTIDTSPDIDPLHNADSFTIYNLTNPISSFFSIYRFDFSCDSSFFSYYFSITLFYNRRFAYW